MQKISEIAKRWWGVVAVVFSIAVLTGGVVLVQRPKETKKSAAAAATRISITPPTISKSTGETFNVNIDIDTAENTVSAADIEVDYDAEKLEGISITAGNYLPVVLVGGQIGAGKATMILGSQPTEPKKGTGTLAVIEFKVLGDNTTTDISISANTEVAAIGEGGNVLVGSTSSTVSIGAPASVEPTAPPTEAPTEPPTAPPTEVPTVPPTEAPTEPPVGDPTATPTEPPTTGQSGDVNGDGAVNIVDIGIIIDDYGSTSPTNPRADLNDDGVVNIVDVGIVIDNYQ